MSSSALANSTLNEKISIAQFGIIMSGFVSVAAGLIVRRFGHNSVEKILPASITGPVAMVIGLTLAGVAISDIGSVASATDISAVSAMTASNLAWIVGLITLFSVILLSVYLKGFWGQLPPFIRNLSLVVLRLI